MAKGNTRDNIGHYQRIDVEDFAFQKKIAADKLKILYENLPTSIPASLLCTTIVFIALYKNPIHLNVLVWFVSVMLLSVFRLTSFYYYRYSTHTQFQWPVFVFGVFLSAALWGYCAFFLMPADNLVHQMIIIVIIAGITAGSVQTLMASFWVSSLFIVTIITPLLAWIFLQNDGGHFLVGLSISLYLFFMLITAGKGYQVLNKLIYLRYENVDLLNKLIANNTTLEESERRFHSAFDFAAIGMALVSLKGEFLKVNESLCQIIDYSQKELLEKTLYDITCLEDLNTDLNQIHQLLNTEITTYQIEKRYICKKGNVIWVLLSVSVLFDTHNKPLYFIYQIQNIDAQKRAEQELKHIAYHDVLTGLANRKKLENSFKVALTYVKRYNKNIALLFMDLDSFKEVNDTLGHDIGDLLLKEIASRLEQCVRSTDILVRLGGDEFVIVLTEITGTTDVYQVVNKILSYVAKPIKIKQHHLSTTSSIGISMYPENGQDLETLIKQADMALYVVKAEGKNNFKFYTDEM